MFDTIGFNEGDVVVVDGESEEWAASRSEDTDPERLPRSTLITASGTAGGV